ncbi:MAG: hypothetical protein RMH84_00005 [Sulfolobales archaeon]|nr:hypothetical protein [Sulfolobales archaeon]MCX8209048.1 hypothetical protein [Sulfolobales archaeon]MDW8009970.1 hypothetical protein [Sulfolobales archaeon]
MKPVLTALVVLLVTSLVAVPASAWSVLDRFRGDSIYMMYEIVYAVNVSTVAGRGTALNTYALHIVIEKMNRTHYIVSALAGDVTYSFTSSDVIFLHALATLYLANLSKHFINLLYVPPSEGVTVNVVLPREAVTLFLNSVSRWYKIVENTSSEVCQEFKLDGVVVGSGVRYRVASPRAELIYDCPTGVLVELLAVTQGGIAEARSDVTMRVRLVKLNFLNLTSIGASAETTPRVAAVDTLPLVLLAATSAIFALVLALTIVVMRKLGQLKNLVKR